MRPGRIRSLDRLLRELAGGEYPGGIIDALGHVHVVNWPAMHLYGIDRHAQFLAHWHAWHMVCRNVGPGSPMLAPGSLGEEVPKWAHLFMWYARRYLFTAHCNAVVARLSALLPEVFSGAWRAATSLLLNYDEQLALHQADYDGQSVAVRCDWRQVVEVETANGRSISLYCGKWEPLSARSNQVLGQLAAACAGELFFARDFDRCGDFHTTAWLAGRPRTADRPTEVPGSRV